MFLHLLEVYPLQGLTETKAFINKMNSNPDQLAKYSVYANASAAMSKECNN